MSNNDLTFIDTLLNNKFGAVEGMGEIVMDEMSTEVVSAEDMNVNVEAEAKMPSSVRRHLAKKLKETCNNVVSRSRYLSVALLAWQAGKDKSGQWRYMMTKRAPGLIDLAVEAEFGYTGQNWYPVENHLPKVQDETTGRWMRPEIPSMQMHQLTGDYSQLSKGKVLYERGSEALGWLYDLFPQEIDFIAYSGSLTSPVLPGGYRKIRVRLCNLKTPEGNKLGVDGSGRAHPSLINNAPTQIRGINLDGYFVKGLLAPSEACMDTEGNPEVWIDWGQIKGAQKAHAKSQSQVDAVEYIDIHLAFIKQWTQVESIRMGYQQWQLFHENDWTRRVMTELIERNMGKTLATGIEGLVAGVTKDDPVMSLMAQTARKMELEPVQVHAVRELAKNRLQKFLYFCATGGGVTGKQYAAVIDNTVEPGTVVMRTKKPVGTEVLVYRFPTILPQGVQRYTIAAPKDHMLVDGNLTQAIIYMNSCDLTDRHQGDDDGDFMGVIDEPKVVNLYRDRIGANDPRVFMVEPDGEKLDRKTEDNLHRLGEVQDSKVGMMSLFQAKLWALGATEAAIAMSIANQESLDEMKRLLNYTAAWEAVDMQRWVQKPGAAENRVVFQGGKLGVLKLDGEEAYEEYVQQLGLWVEDVAKSMGHKTAKFAISWRNKEDKVELDTWKPLRWVKNEDGTWSKRKFQGNLIHFMHDQAWKTWSTTWAKHFKFDVQQPGIETAEKLNKLIQAKMPNFEPSERLDYEMYKRTRNETGLRKYSEALLKAENMGPDEKLDAINRAYDALVIKLKTLSTQDLESIWYHEFLYSNEERQGNQAHAWRAVCWEGSPIMAILGLAPETCDFLTEKRKSHVVRHIMAQSDRPKALVEVLLNSKHHLTEKGTHGYLCEHCMKTLEDEVVNSLRTERGEIDTVFIGKFRGYLMGTHDSM